MILPRSAAILAACLLVTAACRMPGRAVRAPAFDRATETRAVYEALLAGFVSDRVQRLVVNPYTVRGLTPDEEAAAALPTDAWRDFRGRNRGGLPVPRDLVTAVPVDWLTQADWQRYHSEPPPVPLAPGSHPPGMPGWGVFDQMHPDSAGYLEVSPVGFAQDGRRAVLWVMWSAGPLSAAGDYVVLEKTADGWHRAASFTVIQA